VVSDWGSADVVVGLMHGSVGVLSYFFTAAARRPGAAGLGTVKKREGSNGWPHDAAA
jgi:hypothetical protein